MVKRFLIMVSMTALAAAVSAEIVVNTIEDTVVADDGLVSLREAMTLAADPKTPTAGDGYVHIVFSPELFENASEVKVVIGSNDAMNIPSGRAVAIEGPGGDRSIWIADDYGRVDYTEYVMIDVASGGALRLKNLNFTPCNKAWFNRATVRSYGELDVVNCRISGGGLNSQFSIRLEGGIANVRDCTFDNTVVLYEALINVRNSATGGVVNCTFSGNQRWDSALVSVDGKASFGCFGCTFENTAEKRSSVAPYNLGVSGNAHLELASCAFGAGSPMSVGTGSAVCRANWSGTLGAAREIVRDGVKHVCHPIPGDVNLGEFIGYTPDWKSVFTSSGKNGGDRHYVRGTNAITFVMVTKDMVGRDIDEGHISPGSYATLTKLEKLDPSAITINSRSDGTHTSVDDRYSNRFELREVLDYLKANPEKIAAAGETRITFDKTYFTSQMSERLRMQQTQIEIDGFTNRKLVIDGGDTHVMFDGSVTAGGAVTNRLFYVAPGNRVEFRNLEFVNGVANAAGTKLMTHGGGAIYNRGEILVTNCSFRACSAGPDSVGRSDGGAILTAAGARSVLYGVLIENCTAARGGAIATMNGGTNVIAMSTLIGNRAVRGSQPGVIAGGAICCEGDLSRTIVVNSSITGNASDGVGGAVRSTGSGTTTTLYLLDTVIVGNHANGRIDDLDLGNVAKARYCVLGRRTPSLDRLFDTEATNVDEGKSPVDVFAHISENGAGVVTAIHVLGVEQSVLPLANDRPHASVVPLVDAGWNNIGYKVGSDTKLFFGVLRQVRLSGRALALDHTGNAIGSGMVGASSLTTAPDIPYNENPLLVTSGTVTALKEAIENAEANPTLADADGIFNIVFAENVGAISFKWSDAIELNVPIRICGPIEFKDVSEGAFTIGSSSPLYLDQVTFNGCVRGHEGGAILGKDAKLYAVDCVFRDCYVYVRNDCAGGAVCLIGESSQSDFIRCQFNGCYTVDGLGDCIYREDRNLRLVDCLFDGSCAPTEEQVDSAPRVRIDRGETSKLFFDTVTKALEDCRSGDTLVIISEEVPDIDVVSNSLPSGVSVKLEFEPTPELQMAMAVAVRRASAEMSDINWLTVKSNPAGNSIEIELNPDTAEPELDENSQVELSAGGVSVIPSNVKPMLYYGLGRSATPDGDYVVDRWLRADESGNLPDSLSASKIGDSSYYRVIVTRMLPQ